MEGVSVNEQYDESTGITSRVIVDWRASPRGGDLKPAMVIKDDKGKPVKLARGGDARYGLSVEAVLSIEPGAKVRAGDVLARIPLESAKTRDITGGLPRVAELFEARRPKDHAIIAEISGTVEFGRDYKNKRRIIIQPDDANVEAVEYMLPKGKHLAVQDGDRIEKGENILDGNPAPHDILAIKGVEELASFLVNEIQEVYRSAGRDHQRQAHRSDRSPDAAEGRGDGAGDTEFLKNEQIDKIEFDEVNARDREGRRPSGAGDPGAARHHQGELQTRSFISAASFQETTRVLTDAAVNGKSDTLEGLKENVIVGRLIPAGTGGMLRRVRKIATTRDDAILAEKRREEELQLEASMAAQAAAEAELAAALASTPESNAAE